MPPEFYHKFDFDAETDKAGNERQTYHAMVNFADTAIGNYTEAIKAKGMWDEMVIVFSADNGGPVYNNGSAGANNCAPKPTPCSILLLAQACAKESTTGCAVAELCCCLRRPAQGRQNVAVGGRHPRQLLGLRCASAPAPLSSVLR